MLWDGKFGEPKMSFTFAMIESAGWKGEAIILRDVVEEASLGEWGCRWRKREMGVL